MIRNRRFSSEQKKLLRLVAVIKYLYKDHRSVSEMAVEFGVSERTIYRYLNLIDSVDFDIDQDFKGKYFLTEECPLCDVKHKSRENNLTDGHLAHSRARLLN